MATPSLPTPSGVRPVYLDPSRAALRRWLHRSAFEAFALAGDARRTGDRLSARAWLLAARQMRIAAHLLPGGAA